MKKILNVNYEPITQSNFLSSDIKEKAVSSLPNRRTSGEVTDLGSYEASVSQLASELR